MLCIHGILFEPAQGLEPQLTVYKTVVLPLNYIGYKNRAGKIPALDTLRQIRLHLTHQQ